MALPNWLLGRHVTAVRIQVQTLNESTGALASAGSGSANRADIVVTTGSHALGTLAFTTGVLNEMRIVSDKESDNISPVNRQIAHAVPVKVGYDITISEVLRSGANLQLCANVWFGGATNYVLLTAAYGGNRWEIYALMTGYNETAQRGKNVGILTMTSVDNGAIAYTANEQVA